VEDCTLKNLIEREDYWLKRFIKTGRMMNLHESASYSGNTFCAESRRKISQGLIKRWQTPGARAAISAKLMGHPGNGQKPFKVIDPNGKVHEGMNRAKFAREHGLSSGQFSDLMNGNNRTCNGWCTPRDPHRVRKPGELFHPEDVREIRALFATGKYRQLDLAAKFNTNRTTIQHMVTRVNWAHLT
jgi:hypothetical protein